MSQRFGNAVGSVGVTGRDVTFTAVQGSWRRLWVGKDLRQSEVRLGFLQLYPFPFGQHGFSQSLGETQQEELLSIFLF